MLNVCEECASDGDASSSTLISDEVEVEAERNITLILGIYKALRTEADLRPCSRINELFGTLVSICTRAMSDAVTRMILQDPRITKIAPDLRGICARAESCLESHWAKAIAGADTQNANQILRSFPYYDNYVELTKMELSAIRSVSPVPPRRVAFIGSGPLPLTSLCLCVELNKNKGVLSSYLTSCFSTTSFFISNVDNNPQAIEESRALCKRLGSRARGMGTICQDAGSPEQELGDFDVVYLAALVGESQEEKEEVLVRVVAKMSVGSLVVIRTAHSLRTLLYPEFDAMTDAILGCLDICLVVHPHNHIVNSVIIARVKPTNA